MKYILVIPDGVGDYPVRELGNRTPLEAARTPHMDFFAQRGLVGLSRNIPEGCVPGTDIGCMSVFGYDPRKFFTGRGPLEAAELGIKIKPGELAFRCNLVTLEGEILKDFSADHVSTPEAKILLEDFDRRVTAMGDAPVKFYPGKGTGYRNLMVYKGPDRGMKDVQCTPPHDIMGKPYREFPPKGQGAGLLIRLMEESRVFFKNHPVNQSRIQEGRGPANSVWLWGQGVSPRLPLYGERFGLRGGVITAVDLVKGIARYAGLRVIQVPGVTGFFDTNYAGKAQYAVQALRKEDFVAVHVESTDEAGHMGDPTLKIKAIEDVDRLVLGTLREGLKEFKDYRVMVLPDHYTCVATRTHASDPVPFLIYSSSREKKGPEKFCEKTARESGFLVSEGHRLMEIFIEKN